MDFVIQLLLMSDANLIASIFLITGILVYFVDYKLFKKKPGNHREASFSRATAYVYVIGSTAVMVGLQVMNLLS